MGVDLIRRVESAPASYPAAPDGLSTAAAALDAGMIWRRIEAHCAWRWSARTVAYVVEGEGEWCADLRPFAISSKQVWTDGAWVPGAVLAATPLGGLELLGETYEITGTAGSGVTVPEDVLEAFRRLAEYSAETEHKPGASSFEVDLAGGIKTRYDRAPTWLARAIQNSGAGDLLRPYRRA